MERILLEQHALFRSLDPERMEQMLITSEEISVARGETVYDRKNFQRSLGVVLKGRVEVRKESLVVSTLQEGSVFGAAALFCEQEEYPTSLLALTDCTLLLIPQETVQMLLMTCGGFAREYVIYLSDRIRFLSTKLDTVSADSGAGKLARYLLAVDDAELQVSATQLCRRIGIGRATLYRAFDVLERESAIVRSGKIIRILDRNKLHAQCEHV